jgi:small neutral amino acid transporter SnatA (MarC family)
MGVVLAIVATVAAYLAAGAALLLGASLMTAFGILVGTGAGVLLLLAGFRLVSRPPERSSADAAPAL